MSRRSTGCITIGDYVEIRALTLDERLTAAAIIMRDAIEKHDYEVELSRVSLLDDRTHAITSDSR